MCNVYEQHISWEQYTHAIRDLDLGIPTRQAEAVTSGADFIEFQRFEFRFGACVAALGEPGRLSGFGGARRRLCGRSRQPPCPIRSIMPSCSVPSRPSPSGSRAKCAASLERPCARRLWRVAVGMEECSRRGSNQRMPARKRRGRAGAQAFSRNCQNGGCLPNRSSWHGSSSGVDAMAW